MRREHTDRTLLFKVNDDIIRDIAFRRKLITINATSMTIKEDRHFQPRLLSSVPIN